MARWSFDVYCFTESSETQLRKAEKKDLMGFPEMEKRAQKTSQPIKPEKGKEGLALELSYHPCYFLFGHRRKMLE